MKRQPREKLMSDARVRGVVEAMREQRADAPVFVFSDSQYALVEEQLHGHEVARQTFPSYADACDALDARVATLVLAGGSVTSHGRSGRAEHFVTVETSRATDLGREHLLTLRRVR